jgi:hypothetical protein
MTDQTPVTDNETDIKLAREWIEDMKRPGGIPREDALAAARVLEALLPAPPATLADELREWGARPFDGLDWTRFHALADRVEDVEKENHDMERELNNAWDERDEAERWKVQRDEAMDRHADDRIALAEARAEVEQMSRQVADQITALHTANAEVERLRKELGEERSKVHESSRVEDEAVKLSYWLADALGEHVDDQDNETLVKTVQRLIERLTRERTVKDSRTVAPDLPDPADVPSEEMWLIHIQGGQAMAGIRNSGGSWSVLAYNGFAREDDLADEKVTLVARLVPDTGRVIDRPEALDALPVGSVVLDSDGDPWRKTRSGEWMLGESYQTSDELLRYIATSVTVIYEPMSDSGDGRTPDCPTQG